MYVVALLSNPYIVLGSKPTIKKKMAKERMINTKFWVDGYISNLDPIEKLLYLYLLTNPNTNIAGIYEIPLKSIAVDTGIDREMVSKIFSRFEKDKKIKYKDGWVVIKNFIKHQKDNPKVNRGIELIKQEVPSWAIDYLYSMDRLSYSNSNLNSNSNSNATALRAKRVNKKQIPQTTEAGIKRIIKLFEDIDIKNKEYYTQASQRNACMFLIENYGLEQVLDLIPKLKETNQTSYYQITTPFEMKKNIVKVFNDLKKKNIKKDNFI